jgi:gluconokinase
MSDGNGCPVLLVVMGTSGCGKSTFGTQLAQSLSIPFIDGDDLHPKANVEKMSRGESLDDQDRIPWLKTIRGKAIQLTHPVHAQLASQRERSPHDRPMQAEEKVREMAEVLETSRQGQESGTMQSQGKSSEAEGSKDVDDSRRRTTRSRACVIACSALKKSYRDLLRGEGQRDTGKDDDLRVVHLYLKVAPEELRRRMHERKGHFMKESMLQSQLATLEDPEGEKDTIIVQDDRPEEQVRKAKEQLSDIVHI